MRKPDPTGTDTSVRMPFNTGDGGLAPKLAADARPALGRTINLVTSDARTGTSVGFAFLGFVPVVAGIDLGIVGMPGCNEYVVPATFGLFFVTGNTGSMPLSIPSNPAFGGVQVQAQSAILFPGLNAAGILSANGVCLNLGF